MYSQRGKSRKCFTNQQDLSKIFLSVLNNLGRYFRIGLILKKPNQIPLSELFQKRILHPIAIVYIVVSLKASRSMNRWLVMYLTFFVFTLPTDTNNHSSPPSTKMLQKILLFVVFAFSVITPVSSALSSRPPRFSS